MKPRRIQMRRTKGWRKPEGAIYVGRPSMWGNPWKVVEPPGTLSTPAGVVGLYRHCLRRAIADPDWHSVAEFPRFRWMAAHLDELRGHDLACWCPLDAPCHADVLLELANQ